MEPYAATNTTDSADVQTVNICYVISAMIQNEESLTTSDPPVYKSIKLFFATIIIPILCVVGIFGNALNIVVLTRKKFQVSLDFSHEKVAVMGLIFLALSDTLFCICSLPEALVGRPKTISRKRDFSFIYQLYGAWVKNYFIYTSIWLTVMTAVSRYLAICYPLHSRGLISNRAVYITIVFIFSFWGIFTLPMFWTHSVSVIDCPTFNISVNFIDTGPFVQMRGLKLCFSYLWAITGFVIPVAILCFCNYHLIKAIRESRKPSQLYRVHCRNTGRAENNISVTLVTVIFMFIFCNSPSEILNFFFYHVSESVAEEFTTALVITNFLQTLNYSMNFLLYCFVNSRFRSTIRDIINCRRILEKKNRGLSTRNGSRRATQFTFNSDTQNDIMADGHAQSPKLQETQQL